VDRFPEHHDLISFFEAEPKVLDAGIVWAYNSLEFRTIRGRDEFLAVIVPGYEVFKLTWWRDGQEILKLDLERVQHLDVELSPAREVLTASFRPSVGVSELRFQLKPSPHVKWGVVRDGF
jgi:hypothetical protein